MKPYTMTPADAQLILDHVGALNVGRNLVPQAERFGNTGIPADPNSPSIKWSHVDDLGALARRVLAGDPEQPKQLHQINPGVPNNTELTFNPGVVEYYKAPRDGRAGASISSGGDTVYTGAGASPGVVERETHAVGGSPYLEVKAGEYVMHWSDKADQATGGKYNLAE